MTRFATHRFSRSRGLTLIELTTSMIIASILIAAITSAMLLASRALPSKSSLAIQTLNTSGELDAMLSELRFATYVSEYSATAVQFAIPDRTGDGRPEVVRYEWSGTAGDPLQRTFNGTKTNVIENLSTFSFTWDEKKEVDTYPGPPVESAEQLLVDHFPNTGTYTSAEMQVDASHSPGQYFNPTLPADTTGWRVTKVKLRARQDSLAVGGMNVRLRNATGGNLPGSTILDSAYVLESSLNSNLSDLEVTFDASGLTPGQGLCLTLEPDITTSTVARIEYCNNSGSNMLEGSGSPWTLNASNSMRYQVYGKISQRSTKAIQRTYVTGVQVNAATVSEPTNLIQTAVAMLNRPEALTAYWEADFSIDPTSIDVNADNASDWKTPSTFNAGSISGGKWQADQVLTTAPDMKLNKFVTLELQMEDTTTTGSGAGVTVYVDRTVATVGIVEATLVNNGAGSQELTLGTRDALVLPVVLGTIKDLPTGPLEVNLYLNPADTTVLCAVNGEYKGLFHYGLVAVSMNGGVRLYPESGEAGASFGHVRVRAGGTPQ